MSRRTLSWYMGGMGQLAAVQRAQQKLLSFRAYARMRGLSAMAVSRAAQKGRLKECLARGEDGRVLGITSADLADREWAASTDLSKAPGYVRERADARAAGAGSSTSPTPLTLSEASAEEKRWRAKLAEQRFREAAGELVEVAKLRGKLEGVFHRCKTRLLGVPSRAKQALPHLSAADISALEDLVREVLEELANGAAL